MLRRRLVSGTLAVLMLALLFAGAAGAQVTYLVTVNTAALSGQGFLDFQFNPGISSQPATAAISAFIPEASLAASSTTAGNVTGTLPPSITLTNSTPYNDEFIGITFGTSLNFLVTLGGPTVTSPNSAAIS